MNILADGNSWSAQIPENTCLPICIDMKAFFLYFWCYTDDGNFFCLALVCSALWKKAPSPVISLYREAGSGPEGDKGTKTPEATR